ncbi:SDR family oxidoreductase [Paenibacillus crassostreae]|uniref:3-ketoacyl-ACP reductase n=1 Tax=Paenibacillus crassostreae TaxID=1763538 RepID=A0A167FJW3_9BACL|nr:SDR family NAD(P)-dependent oxidoreductase [Paenibacillus crassostreae]AOZ94327.1 3-oxoacyl-[acyl-carrier-protein] reductase [Paenibacillus crassostreae]OAB76635.1 3-ketoacyl-ACP reductase [Paenibacillus crassostreae]
MGQDQINSSRFAGQTAIVTGAGSGIGKAVAIKLVQQGANVALFDLLDDRALETETEINRIREGASHAFDVDIANAKRVEKAVLETVEMYGGVDIVFANAGINGVVAPIEDLSLEDWQKTLSVNLNGTFLTLKHSIPHLKKNGGSVIITSSINGNHTFSSFGMSAYSTSKAGQVAFAKMAALELAKFKIRVNVICPGSISTNIDQSTKKTDHLKDIVIPVQYPEGSQPLEDGPGAPEQVANLVSFLASHEASHITGAQIVIDGAESLL